MGEELQHLVEPLLQVEGLDHFLLLGRLHVHEAHDQIGELARGLDGLDRAGEFGRHLRQQGERLAGALLEDLEPRLHLRARGANLGQCLDAPGEKRGLSHELGEAKAAFALADHVVGSIRRGHVAHDGCQDADLVEIPCPRLLHRGVPLQEDPDLAAGAHRFLRSGNALFAPHRDRQHDAGEQHHVAHRHNGDDVRGQRRQLDRSR